MSKSGGTKNRGRSKIVGNETAVGNKAALQLEKRTQTNRPVSAGGGKNRGDRRDTNKTFAGSRKNAVSGTNPSSRGGKRRAG